MKRSVVCDPLVIGEKYSVSYVRGITNDNVAEEVKEDRFPGYYLGTEPGKGYPNNPRCLCCHRASDMGSYNFLNPLNGGTYRFCQKCLTQAVGFKKLNQGIWDIYEDYWRYDDEVEKKNTVAVLAGNLADILRWFEIEPELADMIEDRLVKHIGTESSVIKPNV